MGQTLVHQNENLRHTWAVPGCIISLTIFLSFLCLTAYLLLRKRETRSTVHLLASNIMFGHFMISLFLFGGIIHMVVFFRPMTESYCWIFNILEIMYDMFISSSLLIFSIERLVFITKKNTKEQNLSTTVDRIILLQFPWSISLLYSMFYVIAGFKQVTLHYSNKDTQYEMGKVMHICVLTNRRKLIPEWLIKEVFLNYLPLAICIVVLVTTLIIFCLRRKRRNDKKHHEDQEAKVVWEEENKEYAKIRLKAEQQEAKRQWNAERDSAIAICLLNSVFIAIIIYRMVMWAETPRPVLPIFLAFFGIVEGIIFIFMYCDLHMSYCKGSAGDCCDGEIDDEKARLATWIIK